MRRFLTTAFVSLLLSMSPAFAGQVMISNGQTTWTSTQCVRPAEPASLSSMNSESAAEDMNTKISEYNVYVKAAQAYMNCMSSEGQADVNMTQESVASAVQNTIEETQKHIDALGTLLKSTR